ncbi:PspC domain-containing protein [Alkalicoccus luteus]|uniref:PspC domain-containing protein n=1 Tax=Alkalicoccus luteus TaxID=1237094 RepID=A0A969PSG1_9BACI|nr:PspC domain-containing protein [Alkalicoccus luteus]NJP37113.1 PspC domain-containing protein [Alkalicoccus luteus]
MKQLSRTIEDRKLAGVCGGLGKYFGVDPTVVRIAAIVLFFPFSLLIVSLYLIGVFLMPNEGDVRGL